MRFKVRGVLILFLALAGLGPNPALAQWTPKSTTTPILIQDGFGFGGGLLPDDGLSYCGPTSMSQSVLWLGINGWTQLSPAAPTFADGLNLDRVMAGLMGTNWQYGTDGFGFQNGLQIYLSAKGIPSTHYTYNSINAPTPTNMAAINTDQTVAVLVTGWYEFDSVSNTYNRNGGHFTTLLDQNPGTGTFHIQNPAPSSLMPAPDLPPFARQTLDTIPFSGNTNPALPPGSYLQWDPTQFNNYLGSGGTTAIIEAANYLTLDPATRASMGWVPATWTLSGSQDINTNGGALSVLAPLTGAGGLHKIGLGVLSLTNTNTTTENNSMSGGGFSSNQATGTPFGTGGMVLDYGTLSFLPQDISGAVSLTLASGAGRQLAYGGGGTLAFTRGANPSLTLTIGGHTNGTSPNLVRVGTGTLVLAPGNGLTELGGATQLLINGTGGNLPTVTNGMVDASIVGQNNDANKSGEYLTYGANGFTLATYVQSSTTAINSATPTDVYLVNNAQAVSANTTAQVYALNVGAFTISSGGGTTVLRLGTDTAGQTAGLILNGGTISTTELGFGVSEAVVYTSLAGGTINSAVLGTGGLTKFGPGALTLAGPSTYTGGTTVVAGTLVAANTTGSATGSGAVTVENEALMVIHGSASRVGGLITVQNGATLRMDGGTAAGGITVEELGTLEGHGRIEGNAQVLGNIHAGPNIGTLTFTDDVRFRDNTVYTFTLGALTDDPGQAGIAWNNLLFTTQNGTIFLGDSNGEQFALEFDFSRIPDPNSLNAFWNANRTWTLFHSDFGYNWINPALYTPSWTQGYFQWNITSTDFVLNYFAYASVPEPGILVTGAIALTGAWYSHRQRRIRQAAQCNKRLPVVFHP